ncbi:hypothetical protein STEG23_014504 [Scotinomys teguina]
MGKQSLVRQGNSSVDRLLPDTAIVFGNEVLGLVNKLHFIPPCHFWLGKQPGDESRGFKGTSDMEQTFPSKPDCPY